MKKDGITDVLIQPTHVINGIENDLMKEDALAYRDDFHSITFGDPLLTSAEDNLAVIQALPMNFLTLPRIRCWYLWATVPPIMPTLFTLPWITPLRTKATKIFSWHGRGLSFHGKPDADGKRI